MAIEDVLARLARAVESQGEGAAVAEIIRQRDAALKERDRANREREYSMKRCDIISSDCESLIRKNRALRAVITKMKAKAKASEVPNG